MLWYHDHALGITAENAYFGQAGVYLITDSQEDALGLPSGYGVHDIPLVLSSKTYNRDGTLKSTEGEDKSLCVSVPKFVSFTDSVIVGVTQSM